MDQLTPAENLTHIARNYDIMAWDAPNESERRQMQERANRFYRLAQIEADQADVVPFHYQEA